MVNISHSTHVPKYGPQGKRATTSEQLGKTKKHTGKRSQCSVNRKRKRKLEAKECDSEVGS